MVTKWLEERMTMPRNRQGQRTDQLPQNVAEVKGEETRGLAAKEAGFGNHETFRQAKTVVDSGIPELVKQMDTGEVSISAVAVIAKQNALSILAPCTASRAVYRVIFPQ